jgi:multiple sugar transport system substrate-binding protein
MKKNYASPLITLLIIALLAAACSSGAPKQAGPGDSPSVTGQERVTLKFWYPGSDDVLTGTVKGIIQAFEQANPGIHVEPTFIPWADYFQKLTIAYSGGLAPDVHGLGFGQLISTVNQGKYLDLSPFIHKDNWEGAADFFPDILKAGQYKEGQFGLLNPEIRPLVWRKDFFKEAGLDPETPPQTFDEIFTYAEKLKVTENGKTVRAGIDIQTGNGEQSYLSLLFLLGGDIYDAQGSPTFDSPESAGLVKRMVELYKSGAVIASNQQQAGGTTFQTSQAALGFLSGASVASLQQSVGADKIGWSLPPAGNGGKRTALMLGTFLSAAQTTKHPEAAWTFIKFWFAKENVLDYSLKSGFIPPLQSLQGDYVKLGRSNEIAFEALKDAQGYGASGSWAINVKYLRLALEEAFNGIRPVEEALKVNAELARKEIAAAR